MQCETQSSLEFPGEQQFELTLGLPVKHEPIRGSPAQKNTKTINNVTYFLVIANGCVDEFHWMGLLVYYLPADYLLLSF